MNKKITVWNLLVWMCAFQMFAQNTHPLKEKTIRIAKFFSEQARYPEQKLKSQPPNELRSAQATEDWQPDSMVTYFADRTFSAKTVYEYGEKSRTEKDYTWDSIQHHWVEIWRSIYSYEENGSGIFEDYDLVKGGKTIYGFDEKGNNILQESYDWDSLRNTWVGNYKFTSSFSEKGDTELHQSYSWDTFLKNWMLNVITVPTILR